MSVGNSFAQGFGLMDRHYARKHRQELSREAMDLRHDEHNLDQQVRRGRLKDAETERGRNNQRWENYQEDRAQEKIDDKEDRARRKTLREREDFLFEQGQEDRVERQRRAQKSERLADEQAHYQRTQHTQSEADRFLKELAHGVVSPGAVKFWKKNPQFDPVKTLGFDRQVAAKVLMDVANPKTDTKANDPHSLQAANLFFWDDLQKGSRNGETKEIIQIAPGKVPGSVVFHLRITNPDGSTKEAPMTIGRGTEDDAEVSQTLLNDLINRVQGDQYMREVLNHPMFAEGIQKYRSMAGITNKEAKLDPRVKLRQEILTKELEQLTKQYEAEKLNVQPGGEEPPELARIKDEIQQTRSMLYEVGGMQIPRGKQGFDWGSLPRPQSLDEAANNYIQHNLENGKEVTMDQALELARKRFPELTESQGAGFQESQVGLQAHQEVGFRPAPPGLAEVTGVDAQSSKPRTRSNVKAGAVGSNSSAIDRHFAIQNFFNKGRRTRNGSSRHAPTLDDTRAILRFADTLPPEQRQAVERAANHYGLVK